MALAVALALVVVPAQQARAVTPVDCDSESLQVAIDAAPAGEELLVSGTCNEAIAILKPITLTGDGPGLTTIDAGGADRAVDVGGFAVTITGMTITGGDGPDKGGGINNLGVLTLDNVVITGNTTTLSAETNTSGGGVNNNTGASLTISNSTISFNDAEFGGGINNLGLLIMTGTTIDNNTGTAGGGISNQGASASLTVNSSSVISGNTATTGGGVFNNEGTFALLGGSSITGNSSTGVLDGEGGGGLYNSSTATFTGGTLSGNTAANDGGAVWNDAGSTFTFTSTTLTGNSAVDTGGAIFNTGTGSLVGATVTDNTADAGGAAYNIGTLTVSGGTIGTAALPNSADSGGAFFNGETLTIQDGATVEANTAMQGGALYNVGDGVDDATIQGAGTTLLDNASIGTVDGHGGGGVYVLSGKVTVKGKASIDSNDAARSGAGVYVNTGGTLEVTNATVENNVASGFTVGDGGGGVYSLGTVSTVNATFDGNDAPFGGGGAVYNVGGTASLFHSKLIGNMAGLEGGAVFDATGATTTITRSEISGNTVTGAVGSGGGIFSNNGASTTVSNSTVSGNSATNGAGIFGDGTVTIGNSTIAFNTASGAGGGLNNASPMTLTASIVSNNTAGSGADCTGSIITSGGYNVIGSTAGCTIGSGPGDQLNVAPGLAALALNNGDTLTRTHAITGASAAHNNVPAPCGVPVDQSGLTRPQGATCDSGAFELANNKPTAVDDGPILVEEGLSLAIDVVANDTDPESDPLTPTNVSTPSSGTAVVQGDGTVLYTHDGSPSTSDSFTYTANDGTSDSAAPATVTLTIIDFNDPPVAVDDAASLDEGDSVVIDVLDNDTDEEGQTMTPTNLSTPANGTVAVVAGNVVYTHDGSETTSDSFTYTAFDGVKTSAPATVTVTITPVNDAPVAVNDGPFVVQRGFELTVNGVLDNDTDAEGDALTASVVANPTNGTLILNPNGSFTYTHDGGPSTSDSFTYVANDGTVNSNVATATISVSSGVTVGLIDPSQGQWHLRDDEGNVTSFFFGTPGDFPITGDWDCDGVDTPGLYRQSDGFVYLRNSNTTGIGTIRFFLGVPGDIPLAGDFDGDGCDTVSVYRPSEGQVYIADTLGANEGFFVADYSYFFGNPGDKPWVGDFTGDGIDTLGLHRESSGFVYFTNNHPSGPVAATDNSFFYGIPNDRLVAGDWNANGIDTVAIFRPGDATFYLRYTNSLGNADEVIPFGEASWLPIAGSFGLS